jgi:hypothetical protein
MEDDSKALTQEEVKDLLDLLEKYRKEREKKLAELPFFNILEEVRVNENAHTRLLMRLLEYEEARTHFFNYLNPKYKGFNPPNISNPEITAEKHRIDGLIQEEGKYAIIIENKVCGAVDQEGQLGRYINLCVEDLKYKKEQIHILYLVDRPGQEPSEQTWDGYKEEFKGRTLVLSYTEDIIPWMQKFLDALESNKQEKEKLLLSGVTQYLDYLKMTFMNSHHIDMEEWLKGYIAENKKVSRRDKAELSERQIIDALTPDIDALEVLLSDAKRLRARSYIKIWEEAIYEKNGGNVSVSQALEEENLDYPKIRIPYQLDEDKAPFDVLVEFGVKVDKVYVGLSKHHKATAKQDLSLREKFEKGLSERSPEDPAWHPTSKIEKDIAKRRGWYGWCEVEPDETMPTFDKLVAALVSKAKPVPAESAEK